MERPLSDNAMKPFLNQNHVRIIEQLGPSKNKIKEGIERLFEAMIDSMSSSKELVINMASKSNQNVSLLKSNIDQHYLKRKVQDRDIFPRQRRE